MGKHHFLKSGRFLAKLILSDYMSTRYWVGLSRIAAGTVLHIRNILWILKSVPSTF